MLNSHLQSQVIYLSPLHLLHSEVPESYDYYRNEIACETTV
ncbi:protein of unknown function [Candidatus Methylomirabilis oxygeniifera]|uniref:Uncharacterized protein n=1 Tax=Methylomirabilis oxygeniifera TaxID=671143 RepID=D5MHS7_METO1|nr:protein of unknown function [Candidatus Methylomirabilis oxyfera]